MNEMIAAPIVFGLIIGTALLTAVLSASLPYMGKWLTALKNVTTRKFNRGEKDIVDIYIIAQLTERIDDLEEQLNNVIEAKYTRDRNRKNNIRRDVRDYLKELQK